MEQAERGERISGALLSLVVQVAAGAPGLGTGICQVSSLGLWTCVRAVVVSPEDDQDPRHLFSAYLFLLLRTLSADPVLFPASFFLMCGHPL